MVRLLASSGYEMKTLAEREIVRDIKEKLGYVAMDFDEEMCQAEAVGDRERVYVLPDESTRTIGSERFRAPEVLFRPGLLGDLMPESCGDSDGIHKLVFERLQRVDPEYRLEMSQSVSLAGGSSLFPGLQKRMHKELSLMAPKGTSFKLHATDERKFAVWMGGSIFVSVRSMAEKRFVTKQMYDEFGTGIRDRLESREEE